MSYERFEQLPVWKAAIVLATQTYALTAKAPFLPQRSLRDQIERAAVAVSSHIAQGFECGTLRELLAFISQARGSAGEVRSMLCLLEALPAFGDLKAEIADLKTQAEGIAQQLRVWADGLQKLRIAGQPASTRKRQHATQVSSEHEEFKEELRRIQRRFVTDPADEP